MALSDEHLVVLTTLPNPEAARTLVRALVEARVAACGTILPAASSVYRWDGRMCEEAEVQVILKTRRSRWDDLMAAVRERHPNDVPELLALPVVDGLPAYLEWVRAETAGSPAA